MDGGTLCKNSSLPFPLKVDFFAAGGCSWPVLGKSSEQSADPVGATSGN